jgi:chaperone required for assembly of F1-ATPase
MDFTNRGAKIWEVATEKSYSEKSGLAFILDGKLVSVPIANNNKISSGKSAIIRAEYSKEEIEEMKKKLELER